VNGSTYRATVFLQPAQTGFYFDDKQAWSLLSPENQCSGFPIAPGVTSGFTNVREPGQSVTITVLLQGPDGSHSLQGSCAAIQHAGSGGREKRFDAPAMIRALGSFNFSEALRAVAAAPAIQTIRALLAKVQGAAEAYGLGQVLVQFAAFAADVSVPHCIAQYALAHPLCPQTLREHLQAFLRKTVSAESLIDLPLFFQTGDNRTIMVEEVLGNACCCRLAAYPHGLFNTQEKLAMLPRYLELWTRYEQEICGEISAESFLHCDTYGQIGELVNGGTVTSFDKGLIENVGDWILQASSHTNKHISIEAPVEVKPLHDGSLDPAGVQALQEQQRKTNACLLTFLFKKGFTGRLVSDEYINTIADMGDFIGEIKHQCQQQHLDSASVLQHYMIQIKTPVLGDFTQIVDAVLYCASEGVAVYVGGTCNETALSARHVYTAAAVLQPLITQVLIRPGMDVRMGLMNYADWQNDFVRDYVISSVLRSSG